MRIVPIPVLSTLALAAVLAAAPAQAQKYGGILKSAQRENPNSLSILDESGSFVTAWPMGGVYNSVAYFDPLKPAESVETLIPDLARSWVWNADYTQITFTLNQGVRWHDGKPFTAKDVKHTFDVVREASPQKLRINPRKAWWKNVKDIASNGDFEVTFTLGRPQPSLLLMLSSGLTPVYAAHVPVAKYRTETMGTGPFKMVEFKRDQALKVRKNTDYFVKGRPYLDGIDYIIIRNKATRTAALQSGQLDVNQPTETEQAVYETLKATVPDMEFNKTPNPTVVNMLLNHAVAPFNNPKLRRAFALALDKAAFTRAVEPGYIIGGVMLPRPHGAWGLTESELADVAGYGDPVAGKEEARKLMAELGYGPTNPFQVKITTQNVNTYRNWANWAVGELKHVHVAGELDIVETGNYYPRMIRKEFAMAVQATGSPLDEPDASLSEGYTCGSPRNYSHYCNPELQKTFDVQSMTIDTAKRLQMVHRIERQLMEEVATISIGFRINYNARRGFVKNFVGHNTPSNWGRMQDVWIDK
ncbi:MAG: ABC transporter substrate-binding protein [Candidatus Lambdaproteobacteria bacterium]|nr:ABC transporter substrate-binding protein [Candidatus Lambdaproteobacteria bacterium]